MLLFTNPTSVLRMVDGGVQIASVNIGGMSFKEGKTQLTQAVSVDDQDRKAFQALHEKGIELEIRKVNTDTKIDLMSILK